MVVSPEVLHRMAEHAEVGKNDVVLEVGTGLGNLTAVLAERAKHVISVEKDGRMLELAKRRVRASNVTFIHGDIFRAEIPRFNKVVSNIPYNISSKLTFWLLEHPFDVGVLMFQLEFAKRLVAAPGTAQYGRLTVNFWYKAEAEVLEVLPPEVFFPRPRVMSAIVRIRRRAPGVEISDQEVFQRVVRALFQHRQQKVRNALEHSFHEIFPKARLDKHERRKFLNERIHPKLLEKRVLHLTPEEIADVSNALSRD